MNLLVGFQKLLSNKPLDLHFNAVFFGPRQSHIHHNNRNVPFDRLKLILNLNLLIIII